MKVSHSSRRLTICIQVPPLAYREQLSFCIKNQGAKAQPNIALFRTSIFLCCASRGSRDIALFLTTFFRSASLCFAAQCAVFPHEFCCPPRNAFSHQQREKLFRIQLITNSSVEFIDENGGGRRLMGLPRELRETIASAAVTLKVYGHLIEGKDGEAAKVMEATFARLQTE